MFLKYRPVKDKTKKKTYGNSQSRFCSISYGRTNEPKNKNGKEAYESVKIREIGLERNVGENFGQKFSKQIYLLPSSRLKIENETRRKFERGTFKKKSTRQ